MRQINGEERMVVYDWELAHYQNPQRDMSEFLAYSLTPETSKEHFLECVETYRVALSGYTKENLPKNIFYRIAYLNTLYLAVVRFNLYFLVHNSTKLNYIERVHQTLMQLMMVLKMKCSACDMSTTVDQERYHV